MKRIATCILFFAFFGLVAEGAASAIFECGRWLIDVGDKKAEVLLKCGEPTWTEQWEEEVIERIDIDIARRIFITIDEWTYNLGPGRFIRTLKFRNGKLVDINIGDYGF